MSCSALRKPTSTYSDVNIFGLQTIYVIVFLCSSVLSLIWYGLFYCLCLLYIVVNNDILQRALRSVTKNGTYWSNYYSIVINCLPSRTCYFHTGKALLWVAALILVILFIYSVISFTFLHESFINDGESALFCTNLGQCFVSVIRVGLIDSLGLVSDCICTYTCT